MSTQQQPGIRITRMNTIVPIMHNWEKNIKHEKLKSLTIQ